MSDYKKKMMINKNKSIKSLKSLENTLVLPKLKDDYSEEIVDQLKSVMDEFSV